MWAPDILAGTVNVAHAPVLSLHLSQSVMERLGAPEVLRCNHDSSRCFDVAPFLSDLDGGKTFRETIGEVEVWWDAGSGEIQVCAGSHEGLIRVDP
jgi:hypothetical protein